MATIESIEKFAEALLKTRSNDMYKLEVRAWVYHSKSRIKNGNEPFPFTPYRYSGVVLLDYIRFGFINVSDIGDGSTEYAMSVVQKWFYI